MEFFRDTNFDFLGKKWPFIIASLVLTAAGLVSLAVKGGPKYGIDFRGGNEATVAFRNKPPVDQIRAAIGQRVKGEIEVVEVTNSQVKLGQAQEVLISVEQQKDEAAQQQVRSQIVEALSTSFGGNLAGKADFNDVGLDAMIDRLRGPLQGAGISLSDGDLRGLATRLSDFRNQQSGLIPNMDSLSQVAGVTPQVLAVLKSQFGTSGYVIRQFQVIGPKIGDELRQQALWATLASLAGMLIYIGIRFEWVYGLAAVIAVFHDTIITVGLFSIFDKDITLTVVAALLTLIGYSMNDTIVVFDRIRENLKLDRKNSFNTIVNNSINQTLSRTIMVSGLTLLTALALWIFGGSVLNGFSFALVVGIIVGTYSSIFIASPILVAVREFFESRKTSATPSPAKAR
jgi:preprotein translocase subunit SecF